jgi:hypothetical protein
MEGWVMSCIGSSQVFKGFTLLHTMSKELTKTLQILHFTNQIMNIYTSKKCKYEHIYSVVYLIDT